MENVLFIFLNPSVGCSRPPKFLLVFLSVALEIASFCCAGKRRTAHKPHSKPKVSNVFEVDFAANGSDAESTGRFQSEEELWARLEELERQEEILGELDRYSAAVAQSGLEFRKR